MLKRTIHSLIEAFVFSVLCFLLKLLMLSYRFKAINEGQRENAKKKHPKQSYIFACWHEHVLSALLSQKGHSFSALASQSSSGRAVGAVCKSLGYNTIYGSAERDGKDKGGARALIRLLRALKEGQAAALTVDGSVGPRHIAKAGSIILAHKSGALLLPVGFAYQYFWELNTWDKFKLPKPFSKIAISYGSPLKISANLPKQEITHWQDKLAKAIKKEDKRARSYFNEH